MPRAIDAHLRLALGRMAGLGATASDIARQLDLPLSTVRGLMRRALQAGPDPDPAALQPRYHACGRHPAAAGSLLETTLAKHVHRTAEQVRQDIERNKILNAEQAKTYGFVDEILPYRKVSLKA